MKREWLVLLVAMTFPSVMAFFYFVRFAGAGQGDVNNLIVRVLYGTAKAAMLAGPILYVWFTDRRFRPFPKRGSRLLVIAGSFGLAVSATIIVLSHYLADGMLAGVPERVRGKISEFGISTRGRYALMTLFLCVFHSGLEEYYWRWFIFGRLRASLSFQPAATLSGLAFMGHHVFVLNEYLPGQFWKATVPFALGIAVGGIVWAWIYERSGSLVGPWLSHFLVDAAIMYVGYRMYFG